MNIVNYKKFACFDYESVESSLIKLGDVVFKQEMYKGKDLSEIGVVIQIHNEHEFKTDMFGNCCMSEITLATREQVLLYRPDLIKDIDETKIVERTFFVLTERKRIKGRISFYIGELINGKMNMIDNDFTVSARSNRGLLNEAVNRLIDLDVLCTKHVDSNGYINYRTKDFNIIHVESNDIAYLNFK
jgi:hypothetical protein